jgi:protease I
MTDLSEKGIFGEPVKGRIGVLIEEHFDQTEFQKFNLFFPQNGYQVVYISHLWGQPSLHFQANPDDGRIDSEVTVTTEVKDVDLADYRGILVIGAYASDRLRYQTNPRKGEPNMAPAVQFLRKAVARPDLKLGTICHAMWLFCADKMLYRAGASPAPTTSSAMSRMPAPTSCSMATRRPTWWSTVT